MEKRQKIVADHPLLFSRVTHFDCGDGWLDLIERLANELEPLIKKILLEHFPDAEFYPKASQVKEKYAALRFYMTTETDEMSDIIFKYEQESINTCEICGQPGKTIGTAWLTTRCDLHTHTRSYEARP